MLEALIDIRHDRESATKRRGDIVQVKLAGSPWSDAETRFHKVAQWEDRDLELQLATQRKRGERHPVITHPYAVYDDDGNGIARSSQFVDVDAIGGDIAGLKEDLLDRTKRLGVISKDSISAYRKDRSRGVVGGLGGGSGGLGEPRIFNPLARQGVVAATGNQFRILAATISTIRPAGGGDFTTLAAWEAFADGQASGDQWAECYTGGDLGYVELNGWTGTINASTYPRVYGAAGNRHDGDIAAGCYATGTSATYISSRVDYVEIDGIRFSGQDRRVFIREADNNTFKNCLVETNGGTYQNVLITACLNALVHNNILTGGSYGIFFNAIAAGSCTGAAYNNTIYNSTRGIHLNEDANTCAITAKNNILLSNGTADVSYGSGTPTLTSDYNLISDGSLTSLGIAGANDLQSQTLADVLTDAANDDFTLAANSPAIDSGIDLSGTVDEDITGLERPQGAAYDRGAFEVEETSSSSSQSSDSSQSSQSSDSSLSSDSSDSSQSSDSSSSDSSSSSSSLSSDSSSSLSSDSSSSESSSSSSSPSSLSSDSSQSSSSSSSDSSESSNSSSSNSSSSDSSSSESSSSDSSSSDSSQSSSQSSDSSASSGSSSSSSESSSSASSDSSDSSQSSLSSESSSSESSVSGSSSSSLSSLSSDSSSSDSSSSPSSDSSSDSSSSSLSSSSSIILVGILLPDGCTVAEANAFNGGCSVSVAGNFNGGCTVSVANTFGGGCTVEVRTKASSKKH